MTGRAACRSCSLFKRQPGKVNSAGLIRAEQEPAGRRRGGGERDPGPRAEAVSRDLELTFGLVSLTQATPRLLQDWAGLQMTFEFLTSAKCHFSVCTARVNKGREKEKKIEFLTEAPSAVGGAAEVLSRSQRLRILILSVTNQAV